MESADMTTVLLSVSLVLGHAISWALANVQLIKSEFDKLAPGGKLGVVIGACVVAGAINMVFSPDLAESLLVVTFSLLGSQVSHLRRK